MTQNVFDTPAIELSKPKPIDTRPLHPETIKGGLEGIGQLLRRPAWFVEAAAKAGAQAEVVRLLFFTVLLGGGLFGAAMGLFRPGPQILSSAVKLPLVLLLTAGLTVPAYSAARWAAGARVNARQDILLFMSTLGLTSLVLAALAPVVLLGVLSGFAYHATILTVVACCAAAGIVGMLAFIRAARLQPGSSRSAIVVSALVFALVGTQMAWTLRPFVARPRAEFQVIRPMEGSFTDSVGTSIESSQGRYSRDVAPLPRY